jgi:hypothetical protein
MHVILVSLDYSRLEHSIISSILSVNDEAQEKRRNSIKSKSGQPSTLFSNGPHILLGMKWKTFTIFLPYNSFLC